MTEMQKPKDNSPRGKWEKKIKPPRSQSDLYEIYHWGDLSFSDKLNLFFGSLPQVIKEGMTAVFNRDRTGLISDKWHQERLSIKLDEYLHWYVTAKGFLHSVDWLGVPTRKIPMDMWVYQEIIAEKKPDYVVEIGAFYGGSTLFLAQVCEALGHGTVVSVDISHEYFMPEHSRIKTVTGDSSDPKTLDRVAEIVDGHSVMLIHDGDHTAKAVFRDLEMYSPLVTRDQYLIVEDGLIDLFNPRVSKLRTSYPKGGPLAASRRFLKLHPEFERDKKRERFIISTNPEGFLRRK